MVAVVGVLAAGASRLAVTPMLLALTGSLLLSLLSRWRFGLLAFLGLSGAGLAVGDDAEDGEAVEGDEGSMPGPTRGFRTCLALLERAGPFWEGHVGLPGVEVRGQPDLSR